MTEIWCYYLRKYLIYESGQSEGRQKVLEKNWQDGLRRICKTLFNTVAMNEVLLVKIGAKDLD